MVVPGPTQKMIKINSQIMMLAYLDSENTLILKNILRADDTVGAINKLSKNILIGTKYINSYCSDYVYKYWPNGMHYYKPHYIKLKTSSDNVYFAGEMMSDSQGWCEGAIRSVNFILKKIDKKTF